PGEQARRRRERPVAGRRAAAAGQRALPGGALRAPPGGRADDRLTGRCRTICPVTPAQELKHIREGAGDAAPPGEIDTLDVAGDAATLARVREVLEVVAGRTADGG